MIQRSGLLWCAAFAAMVAGCGDNIKSEQCGDGTKDDGKGHCIADGTGGGTCGDGTTLDADGNVCIPDSSVCSDGQVIIDNKCQDPGAAHVDLEEMNPDNNDGGGAAGEIMLKPQGQGFVVHGCIKPDADDNADLDDYVIQVAAPTLLDVTADGVGGAAAGFAVFPNDANATYQRFGANVTSTLSKRQIYLPVAGAYHFLALDSRTVLGLVQGGDLQPAGDPGGKSCYYITLTVSTPTTKVLDATAENDGDFTDGKLTFYTAAAGVMKQGYITGAETTDNPNVTPAADATAGATVSDATPDFGTAEADLFFGGVKATDTALIVADFEVNLSTDPAPTYALTLNNRDAKQLPANGTVSDTSQTFNDNPQSTDELLDSKNTFFFDVAAGDEIDGLSLSSNKALEGTIYDADGFFVASFSDQNGDLWTAYKGLLRFQHAGRYYLLADLGDVAPTAFTLTSKLAAVTPAALVLDTGVTAQPVGDYNSTAYTLDSSTSKWDGFTASTNAAANGVQVTLLDPTKAYGRLDPLVDEDGDALSPDAAPIYADSALGCSTDDGCTFEFPKAGKTQDVIVEQAPVNGNKYLVHARTVTGTAGSTFNLTASKVAFTDLGMITNAGLAKTGEAAAAASVTRYRLAVKPFSKVVVTAKPKNALAFDVTNVGLYEDAGVVGHATTVNPGTITVTAPLNGVVDFTVGGLLAVTYDLQIDVTDPVMTVTFGTDAFQDICSATTEVGDVYFDGIAGPINAPTGFKYFGATVTKIIVDANGFISFNASYDDSAAPATPDTNAFPDGTGDINLAPVWDDFYNGDGEVACASTVGGKLIIEWNAIDPDGDAYSFEIVLNPTNNSIEYIYADDATTLANNPGFFTSPVPGRGLDAVTALQSIDGTKAITVGQFSEYLTPKSSILFTP